MSLLTRRQRREHCRPGHMRSDVARWRSLVRIVDLYCAPLFRSRNHYVAMIAEHDPAGPLLDLVTAVLALGDPP
jgi:hypothetical protein